MVVPHTEHSYIQYLDSNALDNKHTMVRKIMHRIRCDHDTADSIRLQCILVCNLFLMTQGMLGDLKVGIHALLSISLVTLHLAYNIVLVTSSPGFVQHTSGLR